MHTFAMQVQDIFTNRIEGHCNKNTFQFRSKRLYILLTFYNLEKYHIVLFPHHTLFKNITPTEFELKI